MNTENSTFKPIALNKTQLSQRYRVSLYTLRQWLKMVPDLGEYTAGCFTPAQVQKITNHLGPI